MPASAIKIDIPIVNGDNVEIESQVKLDKIYIEVTKFTLDEVSQSKPTLDDFFFDDVYDLPLPAGTRETSVVDRISKLIRTGLKSSISSFGSAINLLANTSPKDW